MKEPIAVRLDIQKEFSLERASKIMVMPGDLLKECEKWAAAKGCTEFASDCELGNDISLKFHLDMKFNEANQIICFVKKL